MGSILSSGKIEPGQQRLLEWWPLVLVLGEVATTATQLTRGLVLHLQFESESEYIYRTICSLYTGLYAVYMQSICSLYTGLYTGLYAGVYAGLYTGVYKNKFTCMCRKRVLDGASPSPRSPTEQCPDTVTR